MGRLPGFPAPLSKMIQSGLLNIFFTGYTTFKKGNYTIYKTNKKRKLQPTVDSKAGCPRTARHQSLSPAVVSYSFNAFAF